MKKLLLLSAIALLCGGVNSFAQQTKAFFNPANTDGRTDTAINSGTTILKASTNVAGSLGVQFIATKVSGTVSGTAYLELGLDPSETTYTTVDSLVFTDKATNSVVKSYSFNPYTKYRWRIVTAGSQAIIVKAYFKI